MSIGRQALLAVWIAGWSPMMVLADETPGARLAAIEAAQKAAREEYGKALQRAGKSESARQPAIDRFLMDVDRNVEAALALAREAPADPAAFEALKFVIRTNRAGPGDGSARALRMLLERGDARTPGQGNHLAQVALPLFQYPDAERLLRRVLDENPAREDRAAACYWLAAHLGQQAKMIRKLRKSPGEMKSYDRYTAAAPIAEVVSKDPDALDREKQRLLERVVAEFGDIRLPDEKRPLGESVRGELFAARELNVGQVAPEIEGRDHEGRPFTLAETRGKVVVLTFSGNWCGPCVGLYPQEREMLSRHKDRPFTLVSVNTDAKVESLKKSIEDGQVTWRCWWDGGTDGPITTRWGVVSFPSIFVLDRRGVIRFKDLRGEDLDRAVAQLVKEAESVSPR